MYLPYDMKNLYGPRKYFLEVATLATLATIFLCCKEKMFWLLGLRILTPQAIDVRVKCLTNVLDSPMSWQEREAVFAKISDLFYYQYVQENVKNVQVQPEDGGLWYLQQDF